jgi:hypothetical protein
VFYADMILMFPTSVPNANANPINTQYQGMPAVRYPSDQSQTDGGFLGRQLWY